MTILALNVKNVGRHKMQVDVYRNLHKNIWSIRDRQTGKVIDHQQVVHILDAKFVVQPSGRAKVLREGRKNVHAFVRGTFVPKDVFAILTLQHDFPHKWIGKGKQVWYNPYKSDKFRFEETLETVDKAKFVLLGREGRCYAND